MNNIASFKDIPFTNGKYSIDENGNVKRNKNSHILKPFITNKGYKCVDLRIDGRTQRFLVHRLVAMTYIPNPNPTEFNIINHKDSNPLNNSIENLEWCSYSYNNKYAYEQGNRTLTESQLNARKAEKTYLHKRVFQYDLCGNLLNEYKSLTNASEEIGGTITSISACIHGRLKTYKGYIWKSE